MSIEEEDDKEEEEEEKGNTRYFFDINKAIKYSLLIEKKYKKTEIVLNHIIYNKNKIQMIIENNNIRNTLEDKIENNLGDLKNTFIPKQDKINEKNKLDIFDYYSNCNNNFDLILNSENDMDSYNYKIDEELSNKYYELFYNSLINFFILSPSKELAKNNKLVMNINNDILFNEIKELIKEKKDYLLLYIYITFLILYGKNKDIDIDENILKTQIKSILDLVLNLSKENSSSDLFNILREINRFKPEYMNDLYNAENLLYKSDKLNLNETIHNFSFISLNNSKNFTTKSVKIS